MSETFSQSRVTVQSQRDQPLYARQIIPVTQVKTTATTLFTAPAGSDFMLEALFLSNETAGAVTCSLYVVPAAGSPGATNRVMDVNSIAASTVAAPFTRERPLLMAGGASLVATVATNDDVNAYGWGVEMRGT